MRSVRWAISGLALLLSTSVDAAPSVTLVAPAAETRFLAPAAIELVADPVVDPGRTIARVEFLADGDVVGIATQAPYAFSWANVARGNYALRARVFDSQGARDLSPVVRVHVRDNTPPKVRLNAPEHRFIAPGSIPLSAEVTDRDDPIAKVEFFNGDTLLATTTAEPYTFSWTNVPAGNYDVRAMATDVLGAVGTSNLFHVRVRDNVAPHVRILTPDNKDTFPAPASIAVSLRANDRDDNLTSVELFANGAPLAAFSTAPYEFNWTGIPPGTYALTARATDDLGLTTTSRTVTVTVTGTQPNIPPTVSLTSPTNNATFNAPANIPLDAAAADSDGTVAKVDFFFGSTLIATRTEAPYSIVWTGVPEGAYALTALVTDNSGASIGSSTVNVTVTRAEAKMYFIEVDHLNTPRRVSDAANTTVWLWEQREPFGANAPDENPSGLGTFELPLRLPGQYFDTETNLHYNYFRDYDPSLGTYKESDPTGLTAGLHTYAYVSGSPLVHFDPDGLKVRLICRPVSGPVVSSLYDHCFVHVSCPAENIDMTLSFFGTFPWFMSTGHKKVATPDTYKKEPKYPDNPNIKNKYDEEIVPCSSSCCAYEKDVIARFNNAPATLPYQDTKFNSNDFTRYLITSPKYCAGVPSSAPSSAPGLR